MSESNSSSNNTNPRTIKVPGSRKAAEPDAFACSPILPGAAAEPSAERPYTRPPRAEEFVFTPTDDTIMEALDENGLIKGDLKYGELDIVCPFTREHPNRSASKASYVFPQKGLPFGTFRCSCEHAHPRDVMDLMQRIGVLDEEDRLPLDQALPKTPGETAPASDADDAAAAGAPDEAQRASSTALPLHGAKAVPPDADQKGGRGGAGDVPPLLPLSKPAPPRPTSPLPPPAGEDEKGDHVYTPAPTANPVVQAAMRSGFYQHALDDRSHRLGCPWAAEHPAGASSDATYDEPDEANPIGRFTCSQTHVERRDAASLVQHLGIDLETARAKPSIHVLAGEAHRAATAAERLLAQDGLYFHTGPKIVRIIRKRAVAIEQVNEHTLAADLASKADWKKPGRGSEMVRCDPPHNVIHALMKAQDRHYLPFLASLAHQPFYTPYGELITVPGYNVETGIYAVFNEADFQLYEPTREMAEGALAYLKSLLWEFPFATPQDLSAAVAAMVTATVRPALPQAPAFNINGTQPGSGKSLLGDVISRFASTAPPHKMSYPPHAEEATKAILAALLAKPAVIFFDDMQSDWRSFGAINRMLTSETTTERMLGFNQTATAETRVLVLGTGNNIEPERDMRRRVVSIRLTPNGETPALRRFQGNPLGEMKDHRAHAILCALTIIEAHRAAGQPKSDVKPLGSYEVWSSFCRDPLLWLGEADPATSLMTQLLHDDDQDLLGEFLAIWWECLGPHPVMVRTIYDKAASLPALQNILSELGLMDGPRSSNGKLGQYMRKNCGRKANGLQIEKGPVSERRTWRLAGFGPTIGPVPERPRRAVAGR